MKMLLILFVAVFSGLLSVAQQLSPDQNPNFAQSRDKYMYIADSINQQQSTTSQQTYKAIDYLADKQEAREERREFRRELRMERARNNYYYGQQYPYFAPYGMGMYGGHHFNSNRWGFNNRSFLYGTYGTPFMWNW